MNKLYPEYTVHYISEQMNLRKPQIESLELLEKILNDCDLVNDNEKILLNKVNKISSSCIDFERDFPSICYALATGVGKTRLMGAFITYLYTNLAIKNFLLIAPNLTIYNKLIKDFSSGNSKFVFRGIDIFSYNNFNVITGDTFSEKITYENNLYNTINLYIFNISKIHAETRNGNISNIKKPSDYYPDAFFGYMKNLSDLVMLMDDCDILGLSKKTR